jgi:hypothetical protein
MPRSSTTSLKHRLVVAVLLALLAPLAVFTDRSAAQEGPGSDNAPIVSNAAVDPSSLPYDGGSVEISADVVDDFGIAMVYGEVLGPDLSPQSVLMLPSGTSSYSGSLNLLPNYTDSPVSYYVNVTGTDTNGAFDTEFAGEITLDAQPQFDEAPVVFDPSVEPRDLPAAGGPVTIRASASDNRGISEVYANVTLPDGGTANVPLEPISSVQFEGVYDAPPNATSTAATYGIEITALDDIGQPGSVDAGQITVAPKPAQATGRLTVWPGARSFGRVPVGRRAWQLVVVRNVGPRSTAPVAGTIRTSGSPFSLFGVAPTGLHFRLRPGAAKAVVVEFRPLTVGLQTGSVTILRDDGTQPGLAVRLSGRGVLDPTWPQADEAGGSRR